MPRPRLDVRPGPFENTHWIIIREIVPRRTGNRRFLAQCGLCDKIYAIDLANIRGGKSRSCRNCSDTTPIKYRKHKRHGADPAVLADAGII